MFYARSVVGAFLARAGGAVLSLSKRWVFGRLELAPELRSDTKIGPRANKGSGKSL